MTITVYGKTFQKARCKLDELIKNEDIKLVKKSKVLTIHEVYLTDGTYYKVVRGNDKTRGCKCDKAYIDMAIDIDIINYVIKPSLVFNELPIEERIIYY
jgi:hypothetical protein